MELFYISEQFAVFMLEIAFEDHFYKVFSTPMSQLNHDMFELVYICKAYGSNPIEFV